MPAAQPGIASTSGPNGPPQWNDSSLRAQIRAQRTRSHRWLARAGQRSQCCATDSREKSSLMANPEGPPDFTLLRIEDPKQKIPAFTLSGLPDGWRRTAQGHAGTGNRLTAQERVRHPKGPKCHRSPDDEFPLPSASSGRVPLSDCSCVHISV
jgi:hypothetical protein